MSKQPLPPELLKWSNDVVFRMRSLLDGALDGYWWTDIDPPQYHLKLSWVKDGVKQNLMGKGENEDEALCVLAYGIHRQVNEGEIDI